LGCVTSRLHTSCTTAIPGGGEAGASTDADETIATDDIREPDFTKSDACFRAQPEPLDLLPIDPWRSPIATRELRRRRTFSVGYRLGLRTPQRGCPP
jgi:hypothetical protein